MTLAPHANRKVSSTATSPDLTFIPTSPLPPMSHATSMQSSPLFPPPPPLPHRPLAEHHCHSFYHCVQSPPSLFQRCCPSRPSVLGQSDPTVDEHRRRFPHHCFPYHYVSMNHQKKYNFDCHLHPKSFARPGQLYKFADSGCCLGLSKVPTPYLLTVDRMIFNQPVIFYKKGVFSITCGHLWHVKLTVQPLCISIARNSNKQKFEKEARCQWMAHRHWESPCCRTSADGP